MKKFERVSDEGVIAHVDGDSDVILATAVLDHIGENFLGSQASREARILIKAIALGSLVQEIEQGREGPQLSRE